MQIRSVVRGGALVSSFALVALSGSPALAAEPIARASASGLTVTVAGNAGGTGTYAVTNDGNGETATGTNRPPLAALGNQSFVSGGVLAQEARTFLSNSTGVADACAGLAGQGASVAAAGSGTCLAGGNALSLTPSDVDLDKIFAVTLVQGQLASSINGVLANLPGATDPTAAVTQALQDQVDTLLAPLAGSGLVIGAGAIQSVCTANDSSASGSASIANAGAYLNLPAFGGQPAQTIALASFPANPAPNTPVVVGLDKVLDTVVEGLKTSFETSAAGPLSAALGPLNTLGQTALTQLQDSLIDTAVAQISSQLAPVQENLLDITLNKQSSTAPNQITVTALDLAVGPDVPQAGGRVLTAQIGTSSCGPNGRAVAPALAAPTPTTTPVKKTAKVNPAPKPRTPQVPTSVPAGLADAPARNQPLGGWALGGLAGLMVLSVGAGATAYRRGRSGI